MQKYQLTIIFLLFFFCLPPIGAASFGEGDWSGGFQRPESRVFVHAHFVTTNSETTGTIDVVDMSISTRPEDNPSDAVSKFGYVPSTLLLSKPLENLELTPSHIHFKLTDKDNPASFDGRATNGVMTGIVQDHGMKLPFHLALMAQVDPSRYQGYYQVGPEHFISIFPAPHVPLLLSLDARSGQIRVLLPRSQADFSGGSEYDTFYPVAVSVHFATNQLDQFTTFQWKPKNSPTLVGARIKALPEEEVLFTNGGVTLSGTFVLPPTKGPHPAVVLVSGSGSSLRTDLRLVADFFALNGVAALIYDKRGCGRSAGDWSKSSFDDLAGDALTGLEALKNRPDINSRQIGLWGISQGGWIVSLAASRCADVAFIISVSGPGITPEAQGAYTVEHWMKAAGYSEADVNEAGSLYLLTMRCSRTDNGWDELKTERQADQKRTWYRACPYLDRNASGPSKFWQLIGNYDPVPALHKVHCPVLAIFGESDPFVPARNSAGIWKAALREAGDHDVVIRIFPHADHAIADTRTWTTQPGFFSLQRDWLLNHVTVNSGGF
jgi:pimeloyl-ACP methyl ester carboxylesterase